MIKKTLQPTNDLFIQFSDEEVQELGLEQGQKFSVTPHDDGSFELRPYVKLELDMEEWPREILEMIIKKSVEEDHHEKPKQYNQFQDDMYYQDAYAEKKEKSWEEAASDLDLNK